MLKRPRSSHARRLSSTISVLIGAFSAFRTADDRKNPLTVVTLTRSMSGAKSIRHERTRSRKNVDADAGADVVRRRGVVRRHVGRDDGGDDAAIVDPDAVALPRVHWRTGRRAPRLADRARRRGVLRGLDGARSDR